MAAKKIIKRITGILLLLVVAIIAGGGIAIYKIRSWKNSSNISIGSWQTIGKGNDVNSDDLLSIAQIAVYATFPLKKSEVIYLTATTDSEGNTLDDQHDYVVTGKKFDARYWSITAYDQDGFLIKNTAQKYSYNGENVQYDADNTSYKISLSATTKSVNWLSTAGTKKVLLAIRLYQPSEQLRSSLNPDAVPVIKRVN